MDEDKELHNMKQNIHKGAPTIKVRNKLHGKMFLPTIITTLHNNLREKQENGKMSLMLNALNHPPQNIYNIYKD